MALPKFSFSGWNSQSLAPKVNPATIPVATPPPGANQLVAQTNASNTNLPQWLQDEVAKLNAQQALRNQMTGNVTGGATVPPAFDPNLGVAAVTNARANYNAQINQVNEQARLQNLIQQRNLLQSSSGAGGFGFGQGFTNPFNVDRMLGLDRQIENYQRVNLPIAGAAVGGGVRRNASGWVTSPWA